VFGGPRRIRTYDHLIKSGDWAVVGGHESHAMVLHSATLGAAGVLARAPLCCVAAMSLVGRTSATAARISVLAVMLADELRHVAVRLPAWRRHDHPEGTPSLR
jgi:hypothetical protein